MITLRTSHWWLLLGALLAHLGLFFSHSPLLQTLAALLLTGLLPGWLLVQLLLGPSAAPPSRAEQWLYTLGASYSVMVIVTLLLSYLPGGLTQGTALLGFDALLLVLLGLVWWRGAGGGFAAERQNGIATPSMGTKEHPDRTSFVTVAAGVFVLLVVGGWLRLANLGFAEFHGDEARAVLRAAAIVQGYEDVLFLHKKGPVEILLPTLILALTGQISELTARLPFALAGLSALLAVFALGWRFIGPLAGWLAALLLAFDGYFIAFARFVQYQSVVMLLSALTVLLAWRLLRQPQAMTRYLVLLALFLATGLLAHYDMLAVGVALVLLLVWLGWRQAQHLGSLLRSAVPALLVGVGLVALFYVPFVLHPRFQSTTNYLIEERLVAGRTLPYNNLVDVFQRSLLYSSAPLVYLLVGLSVIALIRAYRHGFSAPVGNSLSGLALLLLAVIYWQPQWLHWGTVDLTVAPVALLLAAVWLAPKLPQAERLLWFWFGALFLLALFGIANARTHVYIFFVPWALLCGAVVARGWRRWVQPRGRMLALASSGLAILIALGWLGKFAYAKFVNIADNTLRADVNSPNPIGSLYGFPLANGWKTVGALYAQGVLVGDYETNERYDWTPSWYTQGQRRCGSTATWYFAVDRLEPWIADRRQIEDALEAEGYRPWGVVEVADVERMLIYRQTGSVAVEPVRHFRQSDYVTSFAQATRADLPLTFPAVEAKQIAQPLHINFADQIWLQGYELTPAAAFKAGDSFRLTLYWQAQHLIEHSYTVSVQAYYGDGVMVAQKDSIPVCARAPTNGWTPGELITDVYDITVASTAPAGAYPLYVGLYRPADFVRLPVLDATGAPVDQQFHLADIRIE